MQLPHHIYICCGTSNTKELFIISEVCFFIMCITFFTSRWQLSIILNRFCYYQRFESSLQKALTHFKINFYFNFLLHHPL